uniref:Uncharacterized protein n=1 Tax=Nothobranchius furzeri TaxID=105023 RepID=A0A1A8ABD3_NOTFU
MTVFLQTVGQFVVQYEMPRRFILKSERRVSVSVAKLLRKQMCMLFRIVEDIQCEVRNNTMMIRGSLNGAKVIYLAKISQSVSIARNLLWSVGDLRKQKVSLIRMMYACDPKSELVQFCVCLMMCKRSEVGSRGSSPSREA